MTLPLNRPLIALLALALPALPLQAQEQRWYQVEVLVVAHTSPAAARAERWPPLPTLAYPDKVRFLLDPTRLQANFSAQPDALYSDVDAHGKQFIHLGAAAAPNSMAAAPLPSEPASQSAVDLEPASQVQTEETEEPQRLPTPFMLLPAQSREFQGKAAYMERNGPYRILFHEVWWQPVEGARTSLPIVLDTSGDEQAYPVLQGTIKLHRSRFLHVDTQLWLNTDGSYLPGSWRMPAPPLAPVSLEIVAAPAPDPGLLPPPAPADALYSSEDESLLGEAALDSGMDMPPSYPYRHAVLLQHTKRMRSNEVHYIDHPLLGMVIKVTPLGPEALQAADYDQAVLDLISGPTSTSAEAARQEGF